MGPYTANNLREKSYNRMKDYAAVAGQLGITHLIVISQTQNNVIMRLARFPEGPTLHFRINHYSLSRQVRSTQRRPYDSPAACKFTW
jgi:ribosome biogenesis protein SSF1/2